MVGLSGWCKRKDHLRDDGPMGKETILCLFTNRESKALRALKQHHLNHVPVLQHIVMRRLSDERVKRHRDILRIASHNQSHIILHVKLLHLDRPLRVPHAAPEPIHHLLVDFSLHSARRQNSRVRFRPLRMERNERILT